MIVYPLFKVFLADDISSSLQEIGDQHVYGPFLNKFRFKLQKYLQTDNVLPISNFDHAVHILIKTFNLKAGDSVILSPFCCRALIYPFLNNNIDILWADIDPNTGTIDPNSINECINPSTKLILHNHLGGIAGHIDDLSKLCKEKGVFFIGDCSQSFLTKYNNTSLGIKGFDASIFSFQTVRIPSTIQGAALFIKDNKRFINTVPLIDYGMKRSSNYFFSNGPKNESNLYKSGFGAVMPEINALTGIKNFEYIEELYSKQNEVIKSIELHTSSNKSLININSSNSGNFKWIYGIRSPLKDKFIDMFKSNGIEARPIHSISNPENFKQLITGCINYEEQLKGFKEFISGYFAIPCGWWLYKNSKFLNLLEKIF